MKEASIGSRSLWPRTQPDTLVDLLIFNGVLSFAASRMIPSTPEEMGPLKNDAYKTGSRWSRAGTLRTCQWMGPSRTIGVLHLFFFWGGGCFDFLNMIDFKPVTSICQYFSFKGNVFKKTVHVVRILLQFTEWRHQKSPYVGKSLESSLMPKQPRNKIWWGLFKLTKLVSNL